jgi:hypothetical protein
MLVAQMADSHLANLIKLRCREINEIRRRCTEGVGEVSDLDRAIYDLPTYSAVEAGELIREKIYTLYPYLAEAFLRDLEGVREELIKAVGREHALENPDLPLLPPPQFDESEIVDF